MTNALDKTNAAAQAKSRLARLARRGVALAVLACAGIGAAQAQYHGRRDDAQLQPQMQPQLQAPPSVRADRLPAPAPQIDQPREQRAYEQMQMREQMREQQQRMNEQLREEQRRQAAQMQNDPNRDGGRRGRLTPDERRDLRRQINEAGMDIYPNAQRR